MFHGSMVALATPMSEDGSIDWDSLANLLEFHIEQQTDAIVAVGTTGESATVDFDEHCKLIKEVVAMTNNRVPVIAGTGANSTTEAIELTQCAMQHGADAALLVTPYYNKPTQEGLFQHYAAIAKAVAIPQILYNVPGRTACDMLPETAARLASISNIVGFLEDIFKAKNEGRSTWEPWQERLPSSYFEKRWGAAWRDTEDEFWTRFKASVRAKRDASH